MSGGRINSRDVVESLKELGEPRQLTFDAPIGATDDDLLRLVRYARGLGFEYAGPVEQIEDADPQATLTPRDLMARHIDRTYPPTDTSQYLAKEHFGAAGVETGGRQTAASKLFSELLFPVVGIRPFARIYSEKTAHARALTHEEIGLVVVSRQVAGIDFMPPRRSSGALRAHRENFYKENFPGAIDLEDAAIQVEGLLELPKNEELVARICTPKSIVALEAITEHLSSVVDQKS